jgi:hypothetical protein
VHFIAAFQVLIYVGAVMVFMVYVIMLLDPRDPALRSRFSGLLIPGVIGAVVLLVALVHAVKGLVGHTAPSAARFGLQQFSIDFLNDYWLHFELTSVLLLAAIVAAIAVIKGAGAGRAPMDKVQLLLMLSVAMFAIGLAGVIVRRNLLVMLMCMELMLNGVNLSLVTFAHLHGTTAGRGAGVPDLRRRHRRDRDRDPDRADAGAAQAHARSGCVRGIEGLR